MKPINKLFSYALPVVLLREPYAIGARGADLGVLLVGALLAGGSRWATALQGGSEAVGRELLRSLGGTDARGGLSEAIYRSPEGI